MVIRRIPMLRNLGVRQQFWDSGCPNSHLFYTLPAYVYHLSTQIWTWSASDPQYISYGISTEILFLQTGSINYTHNLPCGIQFSKLFYPLKRLTNIVISNIKPQIQESCTGCHLGPFTNKQVPSPTI